MIPDMKVWSFVAAAFAILAALLLFAVVVLEVVPGDEDEDVFKLGVLLNVSETGDPDTQSAIGLAIEDLMAFFPEGNPPFRLEVTVRGTGLDPDVARAETEDLFGSGVRVLIGPESSAEVEAMKSFTDAKDMVVISHCASAPSLAIANDSIYRMVPSDAHQAEVLAGLIYGEGARALVPVWRGDLWGDDIAVALREAFVALGGTVSEGVRYDFAAPTFQTEMSTLADQVGEARPASGDAVAVVFLGFGPEAPAILSEAGRHPSLTEVTWYGSEGTVLSREIVQDADAARFAIETGFVHLMFAHVRTAHAEDIRARISAAIGGGSVHYCAMAAYDAVWLAALSAAVAGTDDIDNFKGALRALAHGYEGASGPVRLDAFGDRAQAAYDLWVIRREGSGFTWAQITSPDD